METSGATSYKHFLWEIFIDQREPQNEWYHACHLTRCSDSPSFGVKIKLLTTCCFHHAASLTVELPGCSLHGRVFTIHCPSSYGEHCRQHNTATKTGYKVNASSYVHAETSVGSHYKPRIPFMQQNYTRTSMMLHKLWHQTVSGKNTTTDKAGDGII